MEDATPFPALPGEHHANDQQKPERVKYQELHVGHPLFWLRASREDLLHYRKPFLLVLPASPHQAFTP
jgi:hypothetical protein